jgi:hypothetical protein
MNTKKTMSDFIIPTLLNFMTGSLALASQEIGILSVLLPFSVLFSKPPGTAP